MKRIMPWAVIVVIILIIMGMILSYFIKISKRYEVNHVRIGINAPGRFKDNYTIAQLSDIHLVKNTEIGKEMLAAVRALKTDLIVLTGDYVTWNGDYDAAITFLAGLNAPDGVYAVMGDYDYSNSRKSCLFCHEKGSGRPTKRHNVKFLRNTCATVKAGGNPLRICGLDGRAGNNSVVSDLSNIKKSLGTNETVIVLSHDPLAFEWFSKEDDILVLAGDTHGGQVPLPSWFWKMLGYEKNAKYEQGWFGTGKKRMYVNRGIGTSHIPIRLFRPPEITVFHFENILKN